MTAETRPYTDDQLRAHAAWLIENHGDDLETLSITETAADQGVDTNSWDGDDWDGYIDAVWKFIRRVPSLTEWAVNLGADGLEPDGHQLTWSAGEQPIVRVHFAFHPGMRPESRGYLVTAVGEALGSELERAAAPAVEGDDICGDPNDGDWCELEPGHDGHHRADTAEWAQTAAAAAAGESGSTR